MANKNKKTLSEEEKKENRKVVGIEIKSSKLKRPAKSSESKRAETYTGVNGKKSKTFATIDEAKSYAAGIKNNDKNSAKILKGNKKATHKLVQFLSKIK